MRQRDRVRSSCITVQNLEQESHRTFSNLPHGLRNCGQRRIRVPRKADIVETDHREVPWNPQTSPFCVLHHTDRHFVIEAEDCGGALPYSEQMVGGSNPGFNREIAVYHETGLFSGMLSGTRERAFEAISAEGTDERPCNDGDPPVSEVVKVIHRLGCGFRVVDMNARDAQSRAEFAAIDYGGASRGHRLYEPRCLFR